MNNQVSREEVLKLHREMDVLKHRVEAQRVQIQNLRRQLIEAGDKSEKLERYKNYIEGIVSDEGRYEP